MSEQTNSTVKKLTRGYDSKVAGVCSGIGAYFGIDATVIRVLWVVVTVITGFFPGILAYVVVAFVIPKH